eukprot:comp8656_c0_seq1/m.3935 comp8656_c0_seq1/g.3935  ORF comp8656_c0_seq1/g.3935 comp8656_c0_seq1/m.3935 type:complete len:585 (-) comp8656_c0_seq1:276-2030(-)
MGLDRVYNQFISCKPVDLSDDEKNKNGLARCLNVFDLIAYGLGSCVGAGVFVTTGQIAAFHAGPSVCLSFLFAGFAALLSGLCYAEFAAKMPIAGSAYAYSYATLGELMAWIMGWNLCLEYGISAGTIAVSWASYVVAALSNFGVDVPVGVTPVELSGPFQVNALALLIIIIVTVFQLCGCNVSAKFNLVITIWNVSLICFVIIYGFTLVDADNWSPFMPFGFDEVLVGAGIAFFSYVGFDAVSSMSAEAKNPQRDIPLGLLGTLGIATTLYCLVGLVIAGMVPYTTLQNPIYTDSPISQAFSYAGSNWAASLIAVGSVTTLTCTTLCSMLGQPRIFLAMAQDGLLFPVLGRTSKRGVPVAGTLLTCLIAGTLALFFTFDFLSDSISLGTFMAFSFVCGGVLILRMAYDPARVDPSSQPDKKLLASWVPKTLIAWFGVGSWAFWMVIRRSEAPMWLSMVCLVLFSVVPCAGIIYLWYFAVRVPPSRTFQTPLMPFTPLLGLFVNGCLMAGLAYQSYVNLAIWTGIGLMVYFAYGFRNSNLRRGITESNSLGGNDDEERAGHVLSVNAKEISESEIKEKAGGSPK